MIQINRVKSDAVQIKVVLAGLNYAGKTSMLVALKNMYKFEENLKLIHPTIDVNLYRRNFLGHSIQFFDLGGQKMYRERHIRSSFNFEKVHRLLYLIDISDPSRFEESLVYLEEIMEALVILKHPQAQEVFICFSKMDVKKSLKMTDDFGERMLYLSNQIKRAYPNGKFQYFSTSIFNIYSIVHVVSKGICDYLPKYDRLMKSVRNFVENYKIYQLLLFDHSGLIVMEYTNPQLNQVHDQNEIDEMISENIMYFKETQDNGLQDIGITKNIYNRLMNFAYQFWFPRRHSRVEQIDFFENFGKQSQLKIPYYVSLIIDHQTGKKFSWNDRIIKAEMKEFLKLLWGKGLG